MDIPDKQLSSECPGSGKCQWHFLYNSEFNNYQLPVWKCNTYNLQAIHPDARESEDILYDEKYYSGKSIYSYKDERSFEKFERYVWKARINNIKKFVPHGNFLDIGSSFGGFLQCAQEAGFKPQGLEISKYSAEFCNNKRKIPVFNGNLLESKFPDKHFHVITLIEVIEHLSNPARVFDELARIIANDGLLVIQTANFSGWQAIHSNSKYHYYLPGHFYYYNQELLVEILKKRGFKKFKTYYGVDFGLLPKLLKSRMNFRKFTDYLKWFSIILYHYKSRIFIKNRPATSSLVLYAFKN